MLILHGGKILAADSPENLQKLMSKGSQVIAEVAAPLGELRSLWDQLPEVEHFDISPVEGDFQRCALTPRDGIDIRPRVFALIKERGWSMRELTRNKFSLEDIYVRVTRPNEEEEG